MDLSQQPAAFKLKKALRYLRLYGLRRTLVKIRSEQHMQRRLDPLPALSETLGERQRVGLIGCGRYPFAQIAYYLSQRFGRVIGAAMDIDLARAASLAKEYRVPRYTDNADDIFGDDRVRMVYITSNHASHADYAIRALRAGKHVFVEKPHIVSEAQLASLVQAMDECGGKVFLGFNRPVSRLGRLAIDALHKEPGPGVYNWFVVGMQLTSYGWYLDPGEGGRVLGNLCHWTDFLLRLAPEKTFPIEIRPCRAEKADEEMGVGFRFGDDSVAVLTYSATGYAFEGVRERFSGQRGECLVALDDFERLRIDRVEQRRVYRNFFRDHGHQANICGAYENVFQDGPYDHAAQRDYIAQTGWLALETRRALEENRNILVEPYTVAGDAS